jgi:hypothetical protein
VGILEVKFLEAGEGLEGRDEVGAFSRPELVVTAGINSLSSTHQ